MSVESSAARPSLGWLLLRFGVALVVSWILVRLALPVWDDVFLALGEGVTRSLEPWPLTTDSRLLEDGVTAQFWHVYQHRVPKAVTVDLLSFSYGIPLWTALAAAAPGLPWRRRLRDLLAGWFLLGIVMSLALAARVHHMYGTIEAEPFVSMFDNWRGWTAYFVNMFFLEVGFFAVPLVLALALHRRAWAGLFRGLGLGAREPS